MLFSAKHCIKITGDAKAGDIRCTYLGGLCEDDHDFFCSANELQLDSSAGEDMDKLVINAIFEIISVLIGGETFLCGAAINGAAMNIAMLIIGRILLGIGVGFANQVRFLLSKSLSRCMK